MRRRIFTAVAVAVVIVLAGCGGTGPTDGTPSTDTTTGPQPAETTTEPPTGSPEYDVTVFDSGPTDHPIIEGGITPSDEFGNTSYYATLLTEASETERFDRSRLPDDTAQFVDETDFETASLVVVQAYPKSSVPDYRVESVTRDGDTLDIRINDSSEMGTDDITVETVLIRVSHDGTPPNEARIETQTGATFDTDDGVVQRKE
jgi:predicted small lipoprotein YifL